VQLLGELLSVPLDGRYPTLDLTPPSAKGKDVRGPVGTARWVWAAAKPVLIIFEDLHWGDPTSRELLDVTVEQIERLPVLLIATFVPSFSRLGRDSRM